MERICSQPPAPRPTTAWKQNRLSFEYSVIRPIEPFWLTSTGCLNRSHKWVSHLCYLEAFIQKVIQVDEFMSSEVIQTNTNWLISTYFWWIWRKKFARWDRYLDLVLLKVNVSHGRIQFYIVSINGTPSPISTREFLDLIHFWVFWNILSSLILNCDVPKFFPSRERGGGRILNVLKNWAVSYTHLTLPTIYSV